MNLLAKDFIDLCMVPKTPAQLFPGEKRLAKASWVKQRNAKTTSDLVLVDGSFGFAAKVCVQNSSPKCIKIRAEPDTNFDARMKDICGLLKTGSIRHTLSLTKLADLTLPNLKQGGDATFQSACTLMDWFEGSTVKDIAEDAGALFPIDGILLCKSIVEFVADLDAAMASHRDFAADNILIRGDGKSLIVIDYDDMFLPTLRSLPAKGHGKPGYLHPSMGGKAPYGSSADHFSALVIMLQIALLAIREKMVMKLVNGLPSNTAVRSQLLASTANSSHKLVQKLTNAIRDALLSASPTNLLTSLEKVELHELLPKPPIVKGPYRVRITSSMEGRVVAKDISIPEIGKGMGEWRVPYCPVILHVGQVNGVEVEIMRSHIGKINGPDGIPLNAPLQQISFDGIWSFEFLTTAKAKCRIDVQSC